MNTFELFEYIGRWYDEIWSIGKECYDQLILEGMKPEIAEKLVSECINHAFRKYFYIK